MGKGRYGQSCVERSGKKLVLIATAQAGDAEMAARIETHRQTRGDGWRVIEGPLALVPAMQRAAAADTIVLVDCPTLWLSNLMHHGEDPETQSELLAAAIRQLAGPAIFISNGVGSESSPIRSSAVGFAMRRGVLTRAWRPLARLSYSSPPGCLCFSNRVRALARDSSAPPEYDCTS